MSSIDERNLLPRGNSGRRHVGPRLSAVGGEMDQTVVGTAPDPFRVEGRGRNGVNHAAPMRLFCCVVFVFSNACRQLIIWSRQIRADLFPVIATITCLPKGISSEEKQMRIERRKHNWLAPQHPEILRLHRDRKNVLRLTGSTIESCQLTADDDVWIEWIGNDVAIFLGRNRFPVAERNLAFVAAAFDSDRPAFLLSAVKPIRK